MIYFKCFFNIDFRVNCDRNRIVFTLNIQKFLKTVNSNNREYLTFIKIINDEENLISFMFIVKDVDSILHCILHHIVSFKYINRLRFTL